VCSRGGNRDQVARTPGPSDGRFTSCQTDCDDYIAASRYPSDCTAAPGTARFFQLVCGSRCCRTGDARRCDRWYGGVAEWLKAHAWKACLRETVTWVRIPPPPFLTGSHPSAAVHQIPQKHRCSRRFRGFSVRGSSSFLAASRLLGRRFSCGFDGQYCDNVNSCV
jgi:hypothetical protein